MKPKDVLVELRKSNGLTQDEMADRLFVTRQAVSRWETGKTTPNIETRKLISKEFDLSLDTLLGQSGEQICQSCSMPLQQVDDLGTENDGGVSTEYCTHCYQNGSFTDSYTIDEMIESNLRFLAEWNAHNGTSYSEDEARSILQVHLATLKRWQSG